MFLVMIDPQNTPIVYVLLNLICLL